MPSVPSCLPWQARICLCGAQVSPHNWGMEHEQPKYQQMAAQVVQAIQQGALRPGQRLPSVREWARQFGVSHNTALQAMRTLEDERWIEPRARSGFYVSVPRAGSGSTKPV